jgi:hypothetical protein
MATRPEEVMATAGRGGARALAAAAVLALLLTAGCTALDSFVAGGDGPPTGAVYQVVATWNNKVAYSPDPTHGGAPMPGLAGRLYLFGPQIDFPVKADGSVVVDLYDETSGKPVMLEEWRFDRDTLQKLLREDMIGWGYTMFLPWGTCKADVKQVRLRLCYQPASGSPLYAESALMTLNAADASPGGEGQAAAPAQKPPAATAAAPAAAPTPRPLAAAPAPASAAAPLQVARFPLAR